MNYHKIYQRLVQRAATRTMQCYTETHHIIPRCMGGTEEKENLVELTPEEHYVAHQLLVKMYPNEPKLVFAAKMMTIGEMRSNKLYGWVRRKFAQAMEDRVFTEEHRAKLSSYASNRTEEHRSNLRQAASGKKHSEEAKQRMSLAHRGRVITEEHRQKISAALTGRVFSDEAKANVSKGKTGKKRAPCSEEHRKKLSDAARRMTEDTKRKMSETRKNMIWITNGIECSRILKTQEIPDGWRRGRS